MFDPTTPDTSLPQPPRDPFPVSPEDAFVSPEDETPTHHVQEPQEAAEAPLEAGTAKITLTYARQLDDRAQTMLKRVDALKRELAKVGIVDSDAMLPGMRGTYVAALARLENAEDELAHMVQQIANVRETLETL